MEKYWIVKLPDGGNSRCALWTEIKFALQINGGKLYREEERVIRISSEKMIPAYYCEGRQQKELRPIIEKDIAAEIGDFLLGQGFIKFTEKVDRHGTCVSGTLALFCDEGEPKIES